MYEYPGLRALDNLDFSIPAGAITALVGPNGAGKSTLLRCLAGLDRPLAGTITVADVNVLDSPREAHRRIGFLSDFFGLYNELTVQYGLTYIARTRGLPADSPRILETARHLELLPLLEHKAGNLSRGQRQRLAIAQAIIHQPHVLLLDEPASGLDPEARHTLGALFRSLREQGMTLLVSSHILSELDEYATDVLILDAGRVVAHYPLHARAAAAQVTCRLELASECDALENILHHLNITGAVAVAPLAWDIPVEGGLEARRRLLAELVAQGAPVCGLFEVKASLQTMYLNQLKLARAQSAADSGASHGL